MTYHISHPRHKEVSAGAHQGGNTRNSTPTQDHHNYAEFACKTRAAYSPFSTNSLSPSPGGHNLSSSAPRTSDSAPRRSFDNNLIWCVKVPKLDLGVTDALFFDTYAHTGIIDAYIIRFPNQLEQVSNQKPGDLTSHTGLLVFPNITTANRFVEEHAS
ncbi:hypothetical protein XU18_3906, partial [Perkinsela sp. CCAP 1560/4]